MNDVHATWNANAEKWAAQARDSRDYWTRRLGFAARMIRQHVPPGRALDIGCGPGVLVRLLLQAGFDAHGADIAEDMLERAATFAADAAPDAKRRFHLCPGGAVPFDPATDRFDLVSALSVLDYIPSRRAYVSRLAALLPPGGHLMLSNTNRRSLFVALAIASRIPRVLGSRPWWPTIRNLARTGIWTGGHMDYAHAEPLYTPDALDALAAACGLELVDSFDTYFLRPLDRAPLARSPAGRRLARRWGWNHIALYRKPGAAR
jgi:SAM-dependent methyltransferase